MEASVDTSELVEFSDELLEMVTTRWPKRTNKFMRAEAKEVKKRAASKAKAKLVNHRPASEKKSYLSGFETGKPYHYLEDPTDVSIRAYNNRPHAHLIEDGHVMLVGNAKGNKQKKSEVRSPKAGERFVAGYHIIADAKREYEAEYEANVLKLVDDMLDEGFD